MKIAKHTPDPDRVVMDVVAARDAGKPVSGFATREMFSHNKASHDRHGNRLTRDAPPVPIRTTADADSL